MRAVVNVVIGDNRYQAGQDRLRESLRQFDPPINNEHEQHAWYLRNEIRDGGLIRHWPRHHDTPYAFKPFAMQDVALRHPGAALLWCDASVVAIRPLAPLWERIERDGYWFSRNCTWSNYTWTADSAYPEIFCHGIEKLRTLNKTIPHVIATAFGLSTAHPKGAAFLAEYFRYASETKAFCGPWANSNHPEYAGRQVDGVRVAPCGPPDVLGHRHDQTVASVIAWRLGMKLTDMPDIMAIKGSETEQTILLLDGDYERTDNG